MMAERAIDGRMLAGVPLFAGLDRVALRGLAEGARLVRHSANEALFAQDDPAMS